MEVTRLAYCIGQAYQVNPEKEEKEEKNLK